MGGRMAEMSESNPSIAEAAKKGDVAAVIKEMAKGCANCNPESLHKSAVAMCARLKPAPEPIKK